MDLGLAGRTAIVCGASAGIGLAIAESLAGEGVNVAMFARREDVVAREAERLGALAVPRDVRRADDLERLVRETVDAFGGLDVLVNNSGGPPRGPALELDAEAIERAVDLLLVSVVRLTELCLPHLRRSGRGRVVNIASSSVREPIPDLALSNAVRPGVIGWAKTLAREVGPDGITVNAVAPGTTATERVKALRTPDESRELAQTIPVRRFGEPVEIAEAILFLASDVASFVNGATLDVNGGQVMG